MFASLLSAAALSALFLSGLLGSIFLSGNSKP